jgi:dTDP-4-amino-4,6-dideoxygalactose transaminase
VRVPTLDLKAQYAALRGEMRAAIDRVLESQRFILGPEVEAFERELATYVGARHAVGASSGTDALLLALMALGVGVGDEIVTSPYSFFATAGAIARLGARPVFVDIEPGTFNMDARAAARAVTKKTKAIIVVHLFGQCADVPAVEVPIIEDAAQSIGARLGERRAGTLGRMACFSFFPSKNLGGYGDGGAVVTDDEALLGKLRALRMHGGINKYRHEMIGGNFRLDELQAAVLRVKLPHLDRWIAARRAHAAAYRAALRGVIAPEEKHFHVYNQFVIRSQERDALQRHLQAAAIDTAVYYPLALHQQPCFAYLNAGRFPEAERAARESLALPIWPEMPDDARKHVIASVNSFA